MNDAKFVTLLDHRKLAYAEFGKPNGHPVIYFHGGASSRLGLISLQRSPRL
jgi:hypothetical protein